MPDYRSQGYYQSYRRNRRNRRVLYVLSAAAVVLLVAVIFVAVSKATGVIGGEPTGAGTPIGSNIGQAQPMASASAAAQAASAEPSQADGVVMTLAGDADTYVLLGEEYIEAGCHASGPEVGNITDTVVVSGDVDTSTAGDYEVAYVATAPDGSQATAVRRVHVVESFDAFDGAASNLPVLMYHYVYAADSPPADLNGNYISDAKLASQCSYLHENGYYFPSFQELRAWVDGAHSLPARSIILTFDDGEMGFLKHGIPVLERFQVPATSFVVGKDAGNNVLDFASPYVQFQSHTFDMHRAGGNKGQGGVIYALSDEEIVEDINASNEVTGPAVALAYPFGDNDERTQGAIAKTGVICAFTVKNDRIRPGDNPMALNRVRISGEYSDGAFINLVQPNA